MTDKQKIIDGINVADCEHISADFDYKFCDAFENEWEPVFCIKVKDCYYKQLKRKEQECEKFKKALQEIQVFAYELTNEEYTDFIEHKQNQILQKCEVLDE